AINFDNAIPRLNSSLGARAPWDWRNNRQDSILQRNMNPDPAKASLSVLFQLSVRIRIHILGIRIQWKKHTLEFSLEQFHGIHRLHIPILNFAVHLRKHSREFPDLIVIRFSNSLRKLPHQKQRRENQ